MIGNMRNTAPLALVLLLALAGGAAAGDNADATFSLAHADEISGIGPGEPVQVQIAAEGLVGVREIDIVLDVSPAAAFDLAATAFEIPTRWLSPGSPAAAAEAADFFSATLTTAPEFMMEIQATVTVARIFIGSAAAGRDDFAGEDLNISLAIRPASTAVLESALPAPTTSLTQNYPNPFNPETNIRFDLSESVSATLTVYDLTGQTVRTLVAGEFLAAGSYSQRWDGRNEAGAAVGSGIYFYRLQADSFTAVKKMTLLK